MPYLPYVNPDKVADPEIRGCLERARKEGTPVTKSGWARRIVKFVETQKSNAKSFGTSIRGLS